MDGCQNSLIGSLSSMVCACVVTPLYHTPMHILKFSEPLVSFPQCGYFLPVFLHDYWFMCTFVCCLCRRDTPHVHISRQSDSWAFWCPLGVVLWHPCYGTITMWVIYHQDHWYVETWIKAPSVRQAVNISIQQSREGWLLLLELLMILTHSSSLSTSVRDALNMLLCKASLCTQVNDICETKALIVNHMLLLASNVVCDLCRCARCKWLLCATI